MAAGFELPRSSNSTSHVVEIFTSLALDSVDRSAKRRPTTHLSTGTMDPSIPLSLQKSVSPTRRRTWRRMLSRRFPYSARHPRLPALSAVRYRGTGTRFLVFPSKRLAIPAVFGYHTTNKSPVRRGKRSNESSNRREKFQL